MSDDLHIVPGVDDTDLKSVVIGKRGGGNSRDDRGGSSEECDGDTEGIDRKVAKIKGSGKVRSREQARMPQAVCCWIC